MLALRYFYLIIGIIFSCIGFKTKEEGWFLLSLVFYSGNLLCLIMYIAKQLKGEKTMSERTIITTMEVTKIYKDVSEDFENDKTKYGNNMKDRVKKALDADDVVVTNVQEFVLGDEE